MIDKRSFDSHIHPETKEMTPSNVLEIARNKGLKIAFVDHIFKHESRVISDDVKQVVRNEFHDVDFVHGCEADVLPEGKVSFTEIQRQKMDFVMLSFTHVEQKYTLAGVDFKNEQQIGKRLFELLVTAIDYEYTSVIGHPFSFFLEGVDSFAVFNTISEHLIVEQLDKAREKEIAIEINARTLRNKDHRPQECFIELAHKRGCLFTIGSDAHIIKDIGNTQRAWDLIERIGISLDRIIFPVKK